MIANPDDDHDHFCFFTSRHHRSESPGPRRKLSELMHLSEGGTISTALNAKERKFVKRQKLREEGPIEAALAKMQRERRALVT